MSTSAHSPSAKPPFSTMQRESHAFGVYEAEDYYTSVADNGSALEFEVFHTTKYQFSREVVLEPHELRFQPLTDGANYFFFFFL